MLHTKRNGYLGRQEYCHSSSFVYSRDGHLLQDSAAGGYFLDLLLKLLFDAKEQTKLAVSFRSTLTKFHCRQF